MLVNIPVDKTFVEGVLDMPLGAKGIVVFAHGSGSSRHSSRNNYVAKILRDAGFATLLMDLLTFEEDRDYLKRFDIDLLAKRLEIATHWVKNRSDTKDLNVGYFGASTGAAAALNAAANLEDEVYAVVSRGGRPDLSMPHLHQVKAPTLFLVGGEDTEVLKLNEIAYEKLNCEKQLTIIPKATHLFVEEGTLEEVADKAAKWFWRFL